VIIADDERVSDRGGRKPSVVYFMEATERDIRKRAALHDRGVRRGMKTLAKRREQTPST